jgi:hypothetical protein
MSVRLNGARLSGVRLQSPRPPHRAKLLTNYIKLTVAVKDNRETILKKFLIKLTHFLVSNGKTSFTQVSGSLKCSNNLV